MDYQRRRFNRGLMLSLAVVAGLPLTTTACSPFEARPFQTGAVVAAPLGCKELLARDSRGDC